MDTDSFEPLRGSFPASVLQWWNFAHGRQQFGVRWLVTAFAALATCRQSRAAASGPGESDAFLHSTATSRLAKARTSPRTPKWLRLRRAVSTRGFYSSLPQLLSTAHAPRGFGVDNPGW